LKGTSGQLRTSEESLLLVSVKCKGVGDNTWARANDHGIALNMWVETIRQTDASTILDIAVKTWYESTTGELQKADGAYFVDDIGTKYEMEHDRGDYTLFDGTHVCKGDEICRFQLVFPKLTRRSAFLYLHHPQFERLEIVPDWQNAPTPSQQ